MERAALESGNPSHLAQQCGFFCGKGYIMALRNQPYIPLYVQDILTDEKLALCSAASHGVYLRLLCLLHKQENYGTLLLVQKFRQNASKFVNFANLLSTQMPFKVKEIAKSLQEMCDLDVIQITENELGQKRMIKDGKLSITRAKAGRLGAEAANFASAKPSANTPAGSEYEYENEDTSVSKIEDNLYNLKKKKNL